MARSKENLDKLPSYGSVITIQMNWDSRSRFTNYKKRTFYISIFTHL